MTVGIDTSILLRLLVGEPAPEAGAAREFLDEIFAAGDNLAVSDLVVSETYFALQHHYGVPKAKALTFLKMIFESGEITSSDHAAEILKTDRLASASPGFVDRLIHANYEKEFGGMVTFEKKASRLSSVRVLK